MFREVQLREETKGKLFLHSMPGRYESWEEFQRCVIEANISIIVCLAEADEIEKKSPSYYLAVKSGSVPRHKLDFPIPDFQAPNDREAFAEFVLLVAQQIESGERVLIHCAGGIGRTGTFAECLLHCVGFKEVIATKLVAEAGSSAERPEQHDLIKWHAKRAYK